VRVYVHIHARVRGRVQGQNDDVNEAQGGEGEGGLTEKVRH